jgi:small subunit ribosomal protein S16
MVKIRLRRTGAKKQPSYRLVVTDSRAPRDGRFIEIIGHYNPRTEPATIKVQEDRALHWLSEGAQMTDPVARLLKNLGTLDRFSRLKEGTELEELLAEAEAAHAKYAEESQARAEAAAGEKVAKKEAEAAAAEAEEAAAAEAEEVVEEAEAETVEEEAETEVSADTEASEEPSSENDS